MPVPVSPPPPPTPFLRRLLFCVCFRAPSPAESPTLGVRGRFIDSLVSFRTSSETYKSDAIDAIDRYEPIDPIADPMEPTVDPTVDTVDPAVPIGRDGGLPEDPADPTADPCGVRPPCILVEDGEETEDDDEDEAPAIYAAWRCAALPASEVSEKPVLDCRLRPWPSRPPPVFAPAPGCCGSVRPPAPCLPARTTGV